MRPESGLGSTGWWSNPEWQRAASPAEKRAFVLEKLRAFKRERFMDVTYDRLMEWLEARIRQDDVMEDLPSQPGQPGADLPGVPDGETADLPCADIYDCSPEEWQAVLDRMGATPSEVREVMVRLGLERWRRD